MNYFQCRRERGRRHGLLSCFMAAVAFKKATLGNSGYGDTFRQLERSAMGRAMAGIGQCLSYSMKRGRAMHSETSFLILNWDCNSLTKLSYMHLHMLTGIPFLILNWARKKKIEYGAVLLCKMICVNQTNHISFHLKDKTV